MCSFPSPAGFFWQQVFVFITISKFGALNCALIGLGRKMLSLLLSFLLYGHTLNAFQTVGLTLSLAAMIANFWEKVSATYDARHSVFGCIPLASGASAVVVLTALYAFDRVGAKRVATATGTDLRPQARTTSTASPFRCPTPSAPPCWPPTSMTLTRRARPASIATTSPRRVTVAAST
jgi:hypothetical protein